MPVINATWPKEWSPDILVHAAQTGNRIGIDPKSAERELEQLRVDVPKVINEIQSLEIDPLIRTRALNHLSGIVDKVR